MSDHDPATGDASAEGGGGARSAPIRARARGHRGSSHRRLLLGGLLLVVVAGGAALALLTRPLLSAKHEAEQAQADLTAATSALSDQHVGQARAYVRAAGDHVARARSDAAGTGGDVWSSVPVAGRAVDDERHLIEALDETTSVAQIGVRIYPLVSGSSGTLLQGDRVDLATLKYVAERTTSIEPHLDQALSQLALVKGSTPVVGSSIRRATQRALDYLQPLQASYHDNAPLLRSLPAMFGADGPRTYLLAMLNPAEQRYSGGATLSFTTLRADQGTLSFGRTKNADDLSSRGAYQSWQPVAGNLFHRSSAPTRVTNATFSPWWSVSGEELLRAYAQAFPGPRLDGLIGIDLQGLASLFALTGPVDVPLAGQVDADNLVHVLAGSYDRFPSVAARHRVNAALVPLFRDRFLRGGQVSAKIKTLVDAAHGRHFFTYFRSPAVERRFGRVGLSGDLSATPYDYVGVFSQNLNGSKVDYWQHRDVSSSVRLRPNGSADVRLKVSVTNASPPYTSVEPDPGVGYFTRLLRARVGVFMPRHATFGAVHLDGALLHATLHRPKVAQVRDRKYVEGTMSLDRQQRGTMDVSYRAPRAAEVLGPGSMIYRLSVDPQDLVVPETLHVQVTWPSGFRPSGPLPRGWSATTDGATYAGTVAVQESWAIPLIKG